LCTPARMRVIVAVVPLRVTRMESLMPVPCAREWMIKASGPAAAGERPPDRGFPARPRLDV
jgi:hypothetical protein